MERPQKLLQKLACVLAFLGACTNSPATPTMPAGGTGVSTGTSGTGTTPTAGSGTTTPTAGTTSTPKAGSTGSSGTGSTPTAGTSSTPTAGTGATAGTGGSGASSGAGFAMCGGAAKTGECKAKAPGIYGMKTEVDVWYMDENNDPPIFDAGRGKIVIYFRGTLSDVCQDGSGGKALMHPCGTRLPGLYSDANSGVIQIVFPDELWDKPGIPDYMTTGHTSGFGVGDILTVDKTAGLLGISLTDVNAPWPSYTDTVKFTCAGGMMGAGCFPDQDGDGNPGVTVNIQLTGTPPDPGYAPTLNNGWQFVAGPTSIAAAAVGDGAKQVYIGLRTRLGGSGMIGSDCASGVGAADADDFESRAFACVMKDGSKCSETGGDSDGIGFLDKNVPVFHVLKAGETPPAKWKHTDALGNTRPSDAKLDRSPSKGPQSSVIRLGELNQSFACDAVRSAAYPAIK
jgi:hypothetical protein